MNQGAKTPQEKKELIARIDKTLLNLAQEKAKIEKSLLPLSEQVVRGTWVILTANGRYFQATGIRYITRGKVELERHDGTVEIANDTFNRNFRLAKDIEIEDHIRFLNREGRSYIIVHNITPNPKTLVSCVKVNDWVIEKKSNTYYQFKGLSPNETATWLGRHGHTSPTLTLEFNKEFRLANADEIKQHENFLTITNKMFVPRKIDNSTGGTTKNVTIFAKEHKEIVKPSFDITKCDFYLVTCRGLMGAKVRHLDYATAEKEAKRISEKENHETWILGVVASVKPVSKTEVSFIVKKR